MERFVTMLKCSVAMIILMSIVMIFSLLFITFVSWDSEVFLLIMNNDFWLHILRILIFSGLMGLIMGFFVDKGLV